MIFIPLNIWLRIKNHRNFSDLKGIFNFGSSRALSYSIINGTDAFKVNLSVPTNLKRRYEAPLFDRRAETTTLVSKTMLGTCILVLYTIP